jgi:hypothetical protein
LPVFFLSFCLSCEIQQWFVSFLLLLKAIAPLLKLLAFNSTFNFEITRLTKSLNPVLSVSECADSLVATKLKLTHKKHSDKLVKNIQLPLKFLQSLSISECLVFQNCVHEITVLLCEFLARDHDLKLHKAAHCFIVPLKKTVDRDKGLAVLVVAVVHF